MISEEIKKFERYGMGTVDRRLYAGENITPLMTINNTYYKLMDIEFVGFSENSNGNPFTIRILSPNEMTSNRIRKSLESLTRNMNPELRKSLAFEVVPTNKVEELSDAENYFMLSEK